MPEAGWRSRRVKSWPEGFRECTSCKQIKSFDNFGPFKRGAFGLYPVCHSCRKVKAKKDYSTQRKTYQLFYRAKRRAVDRGIPFSITEESIEKIGIPELCPVFGVPMKGKYAPSLDRVDSSKGYVEGNIQVISTRANTLKNNATAEELQKVVDFIVSIGVVNDG